MGEKVASVGFRLLFEGAAQNQYPSGIPFSPTDIVGAAHSPDTMFELFRTHFNDVTPVFVMVSPEPMTACPAVTLMPTPLATVSIPLQWAEVARGAAIEDFRLDNVPARVRELGDLWKPLNQSRGRFKLERVL